MAGTSDDNSTYLLLYAIRALVARHCGFSPEAERLTIQYANKGHFRRYKFSGGHIDPRHWGACHEELGFYIPVDFERNTVKYVRLPAPEATSYTTRLRLDDLLEPFYSPAYVEMREVRLARDDVLSMLRELGLLSSSEQPPASEPSPPPLPSPSSPQTSEQEPEPQPPAGRVTLKWWLPGALRRWPHDTTDTGGLDYIEFLQSKAPKKWERRSFQNELSLLRQTETGMAKLSKPKNFGKRRS